MAEHWIDQLSHALARHTSRRKTLRLAALLAGTLALGGTGEVTEAKNKKQQNSKGKGKPGKGKPGKGKKPASPQPPPPSPDPLGEPTGDDCEAYLDPDLHDVCRAIRQQCQAPDHFCIHAIDSAGEDDMGVACCPSSTTCCFFGCTDTQTDRDNCGSCGTACAAGELCLSGRCVCGDPRGCQCEVGQELCDGRCIEISSDASNCGTCRNRCPTGHVCQGGRCLGCGTGPPCTGGQLCWDGAHCSDCPAGQKLCQTHVRPNPSCVNEHTVCCDGFTCSDPNAICCGSGAFGSCNGCPESG